MHELSKLEVIETLKTASYSGPFCGDSTYYWRSELEQLQSTWETSIHELPHLKSLNLQPIDGSDLYAPAYYCVLSNKPISESEAAAAPDWIPSGAQISRISQDIYDKLGPLLSI